MTEPLPTIHRAKSGLPSVTLVMASYNRRSMIELSLLACQQQRHPNFEVIVCDDGSSDGTVDLVHRLTRQVSYPLRIFTWEDRGYRRAGVLNAGFAMARNDLVVCTDEDCVPHSGFLQGHASRARRGRFNLAKVIKVPEQKMILATPENAAAGAMDALLGPLQKADLLVWSLKYRQWLLTGRRDRPKMNGANFAVWRDDLWAVNGFDNRFVGYGYEDNDLRRRLLLAGRRIQVAVRQAVTFHLWEKKKGYDMGNAGVRNKAYAERDQTATICEDGLRQTAQRLGIEPPPGIDAAATIN